MRVHLGSDHAGFELKVAIANRLRELGHEPVDHGPPSYQPGDDYPPYIIAAAEGTVGDPDSLGVVIGGSGNGEAISANKVRGARAVLVWNEETARLGREHNNANVISLGAREHPVADAVRFVEMFLATPFSQDPRHVRRLAMISEYERTGRAPSL